MTWRGTWPSRRTSTQQQRAMGSLLLRALGLLDDGEGAGAVEGALEARDSVGPGSESTCTSLPEEHLRNPWGWPDTPKPAHALSAPAALVVLTVQLVRRGCGSNAHRVHWSVRSRTATSRERNASTRPSPGIRGFSRLPHSAGFLLRPDSDAATSAPAWRGRGCHGTSVATCSLAVLRTLAIGIGPSLAFSACSRPLEPLPYFEPRGR